VNEATDSTVPTPRRREKTRADAATRLFVVRDRRRADDLKK
jgi:hypothetical protein